MQLRTSDKRRPASLNAVAAEIAAAALAHLSLWLLLLSMLSVRLSLPFLAAVVLLPALWYPVAKLKSIGNLSPVYAIFLPLLAGLLGAKFFLRGGRELFDYLAKAVNDIHGLSLFPFGDGYPASEVPGTAAQALLLLLAVMLSGLIAYAICRKVRPLATAVTLLPAAFAFLAGLRPTPAAFIFYLVAVTFYLILLTTRSKGTARRLTWLNGEVSAALLVFLLILSLLLGSFVRSEKVDTLRERISRSVETMRYAPPQPSDGMPDGDLKNAGPLQYDERTVLTVETPNAFSMYLRGFTGDELKDGVWQPLSADRYFNDYSLTGPWVRNSYFSPAISLGQLLDLKWQVQTARVEEGHQDAVNLPRYPLTIKNSLAYSDRMYLPYEVSGESKGLRRADLSHEGAFAKGLRGQRSYELTVYQPLTKDYGRVSAKALVGDEAKYNSLYREDFAPAEDVYRQFVEANERTVPAEYRDLISQLAAASLGSSRKMSDVIFRVRNYFTKFYTYSLEPPAASGTDPLLAFQESKTGYDAHFATLAVLLFREAGIPARYAEGYYISEDLVKSVDKETDVILEVPDSAAHAWVEMYKAGIGWVPVEVTPGYYETEDGSEGGTASTAPEEVPPDTSPEPEEEAPADEPDEEDTDEQKDRSHWALFLLPAALLLLLAAWLYRRRRGNDTEKQQREPVIRRDTMENKSAIILNEIKKVIVGKDDVITKTLMAILAGGHVLLEDVPGVGKTTLALAFSRAMNLTEKRVQFTPDTMASDIVGFSVYNKGTGAFDFQPGAVFCNILLADEINRTSPKTQAALLEVMEEQHATVDGVTYRLPEPFVCLATQNPLGSAGTHPLPDSQLDRFMIRLSMGYPTIDNTIEIVQSRQGDDPLEHVRAVASAQEILEMRAAVSSVYVDEALIRYAAELCDKTRHLEEVEQGVSPRAVLALVQMARASAYMRGRNHVIPEDIQSLYVDVCAHRLVLTPRAKIRKRSPEQILTEVLRSVKAPSPAPRRK